MTDADNRAPGGLGRVLRVPEQAPSPLLAVKSGEELTAVGYDERWPGYVLCGSPAGHSGWVPESVLAYLGPGMALVRPNASVAVLAIAPGDELDLHTEANGWYWATRPDGQAGWVLADHVEILAES